jgi:uncharacterized protein
MRKNVAIIGGGASGIISGYLLNEKNNVTIYEKQLILGGNVQTLNKNVLNTKLPNHLNIENGVLGFSQSYYPCFHKLLNHLNVPYLTYKPSISLFSGDKSYPAHIKSYLSIDSLLNLLTNSKNRFELLELVRSQKKLKNQIFKSRTLGLTFDDFDFSQELYKNYMQALFMLSFSTPFNLVSQLPQSLLNPFFSSFSDSKWSFIKGGVYSYLDTILKRSNIRVKCNAKNINITRNNNGIVSLRINGEEYLYDEIVIATTPGSVKDLLMDMSAQEIQIFNGWDDQNFKTLAHNDLGFYKKLKNIKKTPMDFFYQFHNSSIGYNTYQNTAYNMKTEEHYSFSHNLDNLISKESILHTANHTVPKYSRKYDDKIKLLHEINGNNNTHYAGAYLGNGLHEGAVVSAMKISSKLDGLII